MALAGFWIVTKPEILLAEDVATGKLVEILKDNWPTPVPMSLVYSKY
jgi:DNA-binding transcriptional LysR family regulator